MCQLIYKYILHHCFSDSKKRLFHSYSSYNICYLIFCKYKYILHHCFSTSDSHKRLFYSFYIYKLYSFYKRVIGIYKSNAELTTIFTTFFFTHIKSVKYTCILTQPKGASMRPQDHTAHIGQRKQGLIKSLKFKLL